MNKYKCPHCGHEMDTEGRRYHWDGRYALSDCFVCGTVFVIYQNDNETIMSLKIERPWKYAGIAPKKEQS